MLKARIVEFALVILAGFALGILLSLAVGRYASNTFVIGMTTAFGLWYGLRLLR